MAADPGVVVPVAVIADTSERVSRAIVEARAIATDRTVVPAGRRFKLALFSGSGGGVVVERVWFSAFPGGALTFVRVATGTTPAAPFASFVAVGPQTPLEVGGEAIESQLRVGQGLPDLVGRDMQLGFSGGANDFFAGGPVSLAWFLEPGRWVAFETGDDGVDTAFFFEWREVPE